MRKLENQLVEAIANDDLPEALERLNLLLILDRRRAWWALFRAAAQCEAASQARFALVARTYIARRLGQLVGVKDEDLLAALIRSMFARRTDAMGPPLSGYERRLLSRWLPARLADASGGYL